jgi:NRPS condensation-like uncharacterized protein
MERPLGALEHAFWLYDQIHPLHFAVAAKIQGQFSLPQLQRALDQAQQRDPLLRVGIRTTDNGQPYFVENNISIPIRVAPRVDDWQWQRELETEMADSFDWSVAPLARVVLLQSGLHAELIVVLHHSIADGVSGMYLMSHILQGLWEQKPSYRELAAALPIEQACALPKTGPVPEAIQLDYTTAATSRPRPHLRTALLSVELTQQLVERCRREQTTVHGAVSAAFIGAWASQNSAEEQPVRCLSPINVRSQLALSDTKDLGIYISYGVTSHDLQNNDSFWEIARGVKLQLAQIDLSQQLPTELAHRQAVTNSLPTASAVVAGMQSQYGYHLLVTNLGRLDIPQQFGSIQLTEFYGPAVMAGLDRERIVGVATLGDRLSLTVLCPASDAEDGITTDLAATNFMAEGLQSLEKSVALMFA